ncbi:MAG: hypothetical protein AABZ44_06965 [Elusimicrobiota bacterium]
MAEKLVKLGIKRETGYLYFIGKDGHLWRAAMAADDTKTRKPEKLKVSVRSEHYPVKKQSGFLYFLDKNGDISRAKLAQY